jgi:GDSL-like lipase/acylhydrolase family protein
VPAVRTGALKLVVFSLVPATVVAAMLGAVYVFWWRPARELAAGGKPLNERAWESSYTERGRPVPPSGPREGYWGARLGAKIFDPRTGWHEPHVVIPGLVDIDERGLQRYVAAQADRQRVLVVGGSAAQGAYSSSIDTTYFHVLGTELERLGTPADVTVVAAGAWKSLQELPALATYGPEIHPDVAVFLDGLNDLTNGATSRALYGQAVATADGSPWSITYHAHDYEQRVADYLDNMRRAASMTTSMGADLLVVLQPALVDRAHRTPVEDALLTVSLVPHASAEVLSRSLDQMRGGLTALAQTGALHFLDASRIFDDERATTFTDMWHFTDFGHAILGRAIAAQVAPLLQRRRPPG